MSRILFITSVLPWPLRRNGGGQRSALLLRALRNWGTVDTLAIGGDALYDDSVTPEMLESAGIAGCFKRQPMSPRPSRWMLGPLSGLHQRLETWRGRYRSDPAAASWLSQRAAAHRYDLVVVRYLASGCQSGLEEESALRGVPRVLDFDDIDWQALAAHLAHDPWPGIKGRIGASLVMRELRRTCQRSLDQYRHVWVTSAEDARLLAGRACSVLPNIPFVEEGDEQHISFEQASGHEAMFVGDLQFPPNRDGLERFLTRAWPIVREHVADAVFHIVGRGLREQQRNRWSAIPGVRVVGFADDLGAYYARSAFSVVPVYFGGGTKIKVLEALTHGRTVVTTEHAMRGYASLQAGGESVAVASDDAGLARWCIRLFEDLALRQAMARRGADVVASQFSFAKVRSVVDATLSPLLPAPDRSINSPQQPAAIGAGALDA
jgi:hypothetical protein